MYTLAFLESMPTLCVGQVDNLKIDSATRRTWLSRLTAEDGAPYDNMVTVEEYTPGRGWEAIHCYRAR